MGKSRLEAFSDGVIAIIIMILEMKVPYRTSASNRRSSAGNRRSPVTDRGA